MDDSFVKIKVYTPHNSKDNFFELESGSKPKNKVSNGCNVFITCTNAKILKETLETELSKNKEFPITFNDNTINILLGWGKIKSNI
jgi:hypothetical protein